MSDQRLLLLDTASLYFRAYFGVPDSMKAPDGTPVNAVRGLMDFIARLVDEYQPSHLVCCWDDDWRPQWRVDLVPTYKTHRVVDENPGSTPDVEEVPDPLQVQVPIIRDVLAAYGIAVRGVAEMEADDVIGTLATGAGMPVDIVTGDRDLFQLVDDAAEVRVLYTARGVGRHERVDEEWVRTKYGVEARQYAAFATMRGDASDGLPGVAGVGDKTAAALLAQFGSLDAIVAAAQDDSSAMAPGPRRKVLTALDYLAVAPTVVAVRRDLDIDRSGLERPRVAASPETVAALAEAWGLGSSVERLDAALS
ncbi:5'-3' exonuclease [Nocardioides jishulii]|uniref:5'-3' exonuclease n=1 Tax=Nocardioides jishulii TaxID=2575440 RepID=A0A4U2YNX1_9ACTN|nr:5'-3' exonuclease [Nocardioides jishulii]QCX27558.1 5'-3' exonuclease [Nocardioides jishulii]TKI62365.1 5'-3' exonuclease [Nocardioides jishulii]